MIPLIVFYLHIVGASATFAKRWQDEGLSEAVLAVLFVGLLFFVGWSITSFIMKLVMAQEGLGPAFDRDSASLLLLTMVEAVFYYFYLRSDGNEGSKPDAQ